MSQQSEERLTEPASAGTPSSPPSARILPFEPRQSDLQRAIQQRAQEAIDRDRDRDRAERKPKPLKWLIIAIIASLPVVVLLAGVDGFLRAFHRYMEVSVQEAPADGSAPANSAAPADSEESPAAPSEPGVVMLLPVEPVEPQPAQQGSSAQQDGPSSEPKN